MTADPYAVLAEALAARGWTTHLRGPDQMVISSQDGAVWPDGGNSFWVSHREGTWFLGTWAPVGYRVPRDQDVLAVCAACMGLGGPAMSRVPADVASRFGLQELASDEYGRVFSETKGLKKEK